MGLCFYELKKFVGLLLNCNPNVLSLLWVKPNGIIYENSLGQRLRDHRDIFGTKKASPRNPAPLAQHSIQEIQFVNTRQV
jgi:predicted nucleotidyltransferase